MLFRIGIWALNFYAVKKGWDLMKENVELKQTNNEQVSTIRTLAGQVPSEPNPDKVS